MVTDCLRSLGCGYCNLLYVNPVAYIIQFSKNIRLLVKMFFIINISPFSSLNKNGRRAVYFNLEWLKHFTICDLFSDLQRFTKNQLDINIKALNMFLMYVERVISVSVQCCGSTALGEIDDLPYTFYMRSLQAHYKPPYKGATDTVASSCCVHRKNIESLFHIVPKENLSEKS